MRNAIAYSLLGVYVSRFLQATVYTKCRAHWIRDALAGNKDFSELNKIQSN
jgi:hypothetical protein